MAGVRLTWDQGLSSSNGMNGIAFGIGLTAFNTLMVEILLTRVFDVILYPNIGYMIIAGALFAFGVAGIYATLGALPAPDVVPDRLRWCSICMAASLLVIRPALNAIPFHLDAIAERPLFQLACFLGVYLLITVPFFLAGVDFRLGFRNLRKADPDSVLLGSGRGRNRLSDIDTVAAPDRTRWSAALGGGGCPGGGRHVGAVAADQLGSDVHGRRCWGYAGPASRVPRFRRTQGGSGPDLGAGAEQVVAGPMGPDLEGRGHRYRKRQEHRLRPAARRA